MNDNLKGSVATSVITWLIATTPYTGLMVIMPPYVPAIVALATPYVLKLISVFVLAFVAEVARRLVSERLWKGKK